MDGVSLTIPLLLRQRWTARRAHSRMTLVTVDGLRLDRALLLDDLLRVWRDHNSAFLVQLDSRVDTTVAAISIIGLA